jgi:hypothetical protein
MFMNNKTRESDVDDDTRKIVNQLRFPDEDFHEAFERYETAKENGIDYSYLLEEDPEPRASPYSGSGTMPNKVVAVIEEARKREGKTVENDILFRY